MKKLKKIKLMNWYHILNESIPIEGSTLFMGDNGSGKSTILDAIQFALVADLTQVKFNQAANENATRTLQGYTRWMTNSGGSKETHLYNRGDCTSYVLLEFSEETGVFTVGAAIDSFRDGREPKRIHFIANQTAIDQITFFKENTRIPLSSAEFNRRMKTQKGFYGYHEPGLFREDLLVRLGKLSPDFTKVLVKAQAFKPLGQVQQFVMDFLLDPKPLETHHLQLNLSHYKALELKSTEAEKRIAHLEKISLKVQDLTRAKEDGLSFRYLELRAQAGIGEFKAEKVKIEITQTEHQKAQAYSDVSSLTQKYEQAEQDLGSVYRMLSQNSTYLERERIKLDLKKTSAELDFVRTQIASLKVKKEELFKQKAQLEKLVIFTQQEIETQELLYSSRKKKEQMEEDLKTLKQEGEDLEKTLENLKKGLRTYSKEVRILKELIEDEIGCQAPLFCELIDILDEKWQSAIEGYLNTRRFDLILDPKHFQKALSLYEKMKKQLGIFGVGIVDSEKVSKIKWTPKENSLAALVTTENTWAKSYAEFILGDVICAETEKDLRKHPKSITPTCMVYQNHAARQTPFYVFDVWYIGKRGHKKLVEQNEKKLTEIFEKYKSTATELKRWEQIYKYSESIYLLCKEISELAGLEKKEIDLTAEKERLDHALSQIQTDEISQLEQREKQLRAEKELLFSKRDEANRNLARCEEKLAAFAFHLDQVEKERDLFFGQIATEFHIQEYKEKLLEFEQRYREELSKKETPEKVFEVFESQRKGKETQRQNILSDLTLLRSDYNNLFGFSAPALGEDVSFYLTELDHWKNSFLPEYLNKIILAKESALQQLMEDIVHKLRENLDLIPTQFEQINRALRGFHFGYDQYQFTYRIKKEYESFEKLIREAALYEKQPLFETHWKERFRDGGALEALFSSLVRGSTTEVEKELTQYSDYREYYEYDLKILHSDGTESFFSQVNKWKSGGETQSPYYIAVIASLYRLYRFQGESASKGRETIGLILLDEAFNKMDEDRLKATLHFTRKLGLQLIMATPKERAEFIIPHVETSYIVVKDPKTGLAFLQDFHQDLSIEENKLNDMNADAPAPTL